MTRHSATIIAALMLFSMFFGAGNLIFPPMLGVSAGDHLPAAIAGFLFTGTALPVLAIIAVAVSGNDLFDLASRGGRWFGLAFPVLVYLSIGAAYALPRTAAVSFSAAITPITGWSNSWAAGIFSLIFFVVAAALTFDPSGIADKLGKYLTPLLLALLVVLTLLAAFTLHSDVHTPNADYASYPFAKGLIEGYLTMDSLAALAFGIIVVSALRYKGINESNGLRRQVIISGIIAGALLAVIYIGLSIVGYVMPDGASYTDGAQLLSDAAFQTMGMPGLILFGTIVLLACLSTAAGLLGATAEFFNRLVPTISYKRWTVIFSVISLIIATLGLQSVLAIAGPIIGFLYPPAITLIAITLVESIVRQRLSQPLFYTFRGPLLVATVWAALMSLADIGVAPDAIGALIGWAPLAAQSLGWIIPTIVVAIVCAVVDMRRPHLPLSSTT